MRFHLNTSCFLIGIVALLLAGCARLSPEVTSTPLASMQAGTPAPLPTVTPVPTPTESGPSGTVSIWHSWDEPQVAALVEILADFSEQYPDVLFDVLYVPPTDLRGRFETAAREGSGPVILMGPGEWGPALYEAGYIHDLSSMVSSDLLDQIAPPALEAVRYQEALIGLPYSMRGIVLYRNKQIIPIPPEDFDDVIQLAQSATQDETLGAYLERSYFFSAGHLLGLGGRLMLEDGEPAFDDAFGLQWIELLRAYEQAGPTAFLSDEDLTLFKEGRVGWITEGTWQRDDLAAAIGPENLAIDPWPTYGDGRLAGFVQVENLYLSREAVSAVTLGARAGGDPQSAAWLFVEYFLSPQVQSRLADSGRIPVLTGTEAEDPLLAQAVTALSQGVTYPVIEEADLYPATLDIALQSIFQEEADPLDALNQAAESIRRDLDEMRAAPEATPGS